MPVTNVKSNWVDGDLHFLDKEGNTLLVVTQGGLGFSRKVNLAAATQAVTVAQSGQKFVAALDAVFTLPAAAAGTKGIWYEFECGAVSTGVGFAISPASVDHIRGNGLTSTDNKDLINTAATDRLGDMARVYCDGVDGWVIEAVVGTFAKEA